MLKIILVKRFCPLKTSIGFRLPRAGVFPEVTLIKEYIPASEIPEESDRCFDLTF